MSAAPVPQVTKNPDGTVITVQKVPGFGVQPSGGGMGEKLLLAGSVTRMSGVKINPDGRRAAGKSAYA